MSLSLSFMTKWMLSFANETDFFFSEIFTEENQNFSVAKNFFFDKKKRAIAGGDITLRVTKETWIPLKSREDKSPSYCSSFQEIMKKKKTVNYNSK